MSSVTPALAFSARPNRRRYTRVSTRQMRSCYLARGIGPADGWVVDISLGGVFLRTAWPLPIGEKLAIELPGTKKPVCVRGRVVSSTPSGTTAARMGMGVRFDELDPMTLTELRDLVSSLAPAGTALEVQPADDEITAVAPIPRPSAPLPKLTAASPMPIEVAPPRPSAPGPESPELLKLHARGLLMQVGDLQTQLCAKDREIETLREAVERLQAANAQLQRNLR